MKSHHCFHVPLFLRGLHPLLFCAFPDLRLVEWAEVAADLQILAIEPDGTLVGLAVLGVVDFAAFPLVLFLGEARQDVDTNQLAAPQALVRIVDVELAVAFLQPDNLAVQLVTTLVNLHLGFTTFCYPRADNALSVSGH